MKPLSSVPSWKAWLKAFRLRTLPLAMASILMGSFLAYARGVFRTEVFVLASLTTLLLQVLSNLANDYGDSVHGADGDARKGPQRMVQAGIISPQAMKRAMGVFALLSLLSGLALLWVSLGWGMAFWVFLGIGLLGIVAAVTYTSGPKPYGYAGLGDISVMLFFGWVGVMGVYYLYAGVFDAYILLPATSSGLLATAVLNVNNIRDIASDKQAGKMSIPVRIGRKAACRYHAVLLSGALVCAFAYVLLQGYTPQGYLFLLAAPFLLINQQAVLHKTDPRDLDPYLKQMALSALLFTLLFGAGLLWYMRA